MKGRVRSSRDLPTGLEAFEAFLTNSVIEVVPFVRIDGQALGPGHPGPIIRTFQKAYGGLTVDAAGARS